MIEENKKISTNISKIVKQVKKEHFIKLAFQILTLTLLLFWVSMVLATSIDDYVRIYTYGTPIKLTAENLEFYLNKIDSAVGAYKVDGLNVKEILTMTNNNPMLLLGNKETMGWWFAILLSPIGFLGLLSYISIQKNMITPQAIKKTIRKALQFNYLKQPQVDRIVDEIDINIGIKELEDETKEEKET